MFSTYCHKNENNKEKYFEKPIDYNNRESMIAFLEKHPRYWTMNSWNRLDSYAHCVKIYLLGLTKEEADLAYDMLCDPDVDTFEWDMTVHDLITGFEAETGYSAGFNGRSGGYLVMYDTKDGKTLSTGVYQNTDFDDYENIELKEMCQPVVAFDRLCDNIRFALIDFLHHSHIKEEEVTVTKTVRTLTHD